MEDSNNWLDQHHLFHIKLEYYNKSFSLFPWCHTLSLSFRQIDVFSFSFFSISFFLSPPLLASLFPYIDTCLVLISTVVQSSTEFSGIFSPPLSVSSLPLSWNFDFWEYLYNSDCFICIQCGRNWVETPSLRLR